MLSSSHVRVFYSKRRWRTNSSLVHELKILTSKKVDCLLLFPKILSLDIKSCTFLSIGASEGETPSSQQMESGFYTNVRAYLDTATVKL